MKVKFWLITSVITVLSCFNVYCTEPYVLFGTLGSGASSSTLTIVNQETGGIQSLIGNIGYTVNGLAYDPTTQTLYGTTASNDPTFIGLIAIDIATGTGTPIGNGWNGDTIFTLACNATGQLYAWNAWSRLVSVDKTTGTFMPIGGNLNTRQQGMDFNENGTLYLFNGNTTNPNIFTIDTGTGMHTSAGHYVNLVGDGTVHHGKFNPLDGCFWGISSTSGPRYISIVTVNGSYIKSLEEPAGLHTLAFAPLNAISSIFISLRGKQKQNKFLCETDYYNRLKWINRSILGLPTTYQVYRDQWLIATIPGSSSHFEDHNQPRKQPASYFIRAIYPNGSILSSDTITID